MLFGDRFNFLRGFKFSIMPEGEGGGGSGGGAGGEGGEGGEGGGAEGDKTGKGGKGGENDTVSRADHQRALDDMKKFKARAKELEDKEKAQETARLKEANDWKTLAEKRENEAKEASERAERIQESYIGDRKYSSILSEANKLNLRPEAVADLEGLDLSSVQVETTNTGKINVLGAKEFAERLKTLKPHWFADKGTTRVNSGSTGVRDSGEPITAKQLLEAEMKGRKSGDLSEYHSLHKKFQTQRATSIRR